MSLEFISLETIQDWAGQYGYWLIFFGILIENSGIPVPGETITIVGGFLAGNGDLSFPWVFGSAVMGAIAGDSCGYWIGRLGGLAVLETLGRTFRLPSGEIARVREKFSVNGDRTIFFGRFIAFLRAFSSPMAGASGIPYPRFLIFSISGATTWAAAITCLSYFAGRFVPLEKLVSYIVRFGVFVLVGVVAWFLLPILWRRVKGTPNVKISGTGEPVSEIQPAKSGASVNFETKNLDEAIAPSLANPPS
jgi:membrane protein DedA with SNARE-associated domain